MSEQWWENAPESDNRFNPTHPDYIPPLYINTDWDGSSNQIGSVHQRQQKFFQKYVSINSFTETVYATSQRGEIKRWKPQVGTRHII